MSDYRTESDSMGQMQVPSDALYAAQTARAALNFPISGWTMPRRFIAALGLVKLACARAHLEATTKPKELKELEAEIDQINKEIDAATRAEEFEKCAELKRQREALCREQEEKEQQWEETKRRLVSPGCRYGGLW